MTPAEISQRRLRRQMMVSSAAITIRDSLGGSSGPVEERLEHVRVAALGAVADCYAMFHALKAKKLITETEEQEFLDWGYEELCRRINAGKTAKIFDGVGNG